MDPDRPTPTDRATLDDAALAALIRDAVDDWRLPPQRVDDVTWRDRLGRRRTGAGSGVRWTRSFLGAAAIAVAATISLSFAAVWLTAPRSDQGAVRSSATPGGSSTAGPSGSAAPAASQQLPSLIRNGDLPTPSRIMVQSGMVQSGEAYHIADLATGTLGPEVIGAHVGPTAVFARPGGGWVCICGDWTRREPGAPNGLRLTLETVDAAGVRGAPEVLKDLEGASDPATPTSLQSQLVDAGSTATPDGRFVLVSWSRRDGAAGVIAGVDTLDLATLRVVGSREVTVAEPELIDGRPRTRLAPVATLSPSGRTLLMAGHWYTTDPVTFIVVESGTDFWIAPFDAGAIGALASAGATGTDVCGEFDSAGLIDDPAAGGPLYYVICAAPGGGLAIARIGADGRLVDATDLPLGQEATLMTRTKDAVFIWDPAPLTLARFDLRTAVTTVGRGEVAATSSDAGEALATLGRRVGQWLAPSVDAKISQQLGIIASPDGSRIFALGYVGAGGAPGLTRVFAFDATSLRSVPWAATAGFTSLAVNADGSVVYAAAETGVATDPGDMPDAGASISAYDAATGAIRVIAGQLETEVIRLTEETCR